MDPYKETFNTWNKVASLYEEKFMHLDLYNESYDIFCKSLPGKKSRVLDIGCGPGNITKYLLSQEPGLIIVGIDVAANMIELAQKNNPTAKFEVMDCRNIHLPDSKFDGVMCGFCIPYLSEEDVSKLVHDCSQLLNESGILYMSFVEGEKTRSGFKASSTGDQTYFYYHDLDLIESVLSVNGFEEIALLFANYSGTNEDSEKHTLLIAKKKLPKNLRAL